MSRAGLGSQGSLHDAAAPPVNHQSEAERAEMGGVGGYVPVQGLHPFRAAFVGRLRHIRRDRAVPIQRLLQMWQTSAAFILLKCECECDVNVDLLWPGISQNALWPRLAT